MRQLKILGTGCPKCNALADNARAAAAQLGVECDIQKVTDLNEIMNHGVMMTPGLMIDGEVKSSGKVLDVVSIRKMLETS
jgi:small redox-active disulfide protein 2